MLCESCKHPLPPLDALPTPSQTARLRNLLRSSHFPPDPSHYRSQISSSTTALTQCDIEIQRLEQTLQALLADRMKLQAYVDGCRSALSPVRRLPPELLCEIFPSYSESPPEDSEDESESDDESYAKIREIKNLSKWDMLLLSHVCTQWRTLVMGTPKLWANITVCGADWPDDPTRPLELLRTLIERGEHHPLTLRVDLAALPQSTAEIVLDLVVEHCERWQSVSFAMDMDISILSRMYPIKGRVGMLERLEMQFWMSQADSADIDLTVFETAPRLTHVRFGDLNLRGCLKLPWMQLRSFIYQYEQRQDIAASLALMRNLHPETAFELRAFDAWMHNLPLALPPLTATLSSFLIAPCTRRDPHEAVQALGDLLNCLTLPHLSRFSIDRVLPPMFRNAIFWPMNQFESLSMRSSFGDTLRTLELVHVIITEDELLRTLASLPSLERLVIADQHDIHEHSDHTLITDALLRGLAAIPTSSDLCLVPKLKYFACSSFFEFSALVYFDFISSRVGPDRTPFHSVLRYFSGTACEVEPVVLSKLLELVDKGELKFQLEEESRDKYPIQFRIYSFV
ncbi:hypothetical protein FB451DRAFT_1520288 [Mycena latifolia]|nr:hypothetical protein FB451DRAFT_1520288 [Mycena latifolia]